jgi:hypothetical protein
VAEASTDTSDAAWEQAIRRTLTSKAAGVRPSRDDPAGIAVARARRVQRRRRTVGLAAVVVATIVATGALINGIPGPGPGTGGPVSLSGMFGDPVVERRPDPVEGPLVVDQSVAEQVATDVIGTGADGGLVLATEDGQIADLDAIGHVTSAHRVGDGWAVISGNAGTVRLWWVVPDARPAALLSGMNAVVVEDGQVAWRRGSMMAAAVISSTGRLRQRVNIAAPEGGGDPVGFLGGAVLLGRAEDDGATSWDVWHPSDSGYVPQWTQDVLWVYGTLPGGTTAVGLVSPPPGAQEPCLAKLTVDTGLRVSPRLCLPDLPGAGAAAISPGGRWLVGAAEPAAPGEPPAGPVVVVDLSAAFAQAPDYAASVDVVGAPTGRPVWTSADQVLFSTVDGIVRLWPDRVLDGAAEAVELMPASGDTPVLVDAGPD